MNNESQNHRIPDINVYKAGQLLKRCRQNELSMSVPTLIPKLTAEISKFREKTPKVDKCMISKIESGYYTSPLGREYVYCYAKALGINWDEFIQKLKNNRQTIFLLSDDEKFALVIKYMKEIRSHKEQITGYDLDRLLLALEPYVKKPQLTFDDQN